jgi:tetratricopeptide (TPR) repeat protein
MAVLPGGRSRRIAAAVLALAAGAGTFLATRTAGGAGPSALLVGLDGVDWRILRPLLEKGSLPNLGGLVERGTVASLASIEPLISPPIWTSIATGVKPERHGITWFLSDTDRPGQRIPVTSAQRRTKALWNMLSERGRSVSVVGWWATFPAERVRGYLVSDFVGYHGFGNSGRAVQTDLGKTYPPGFLDEIRSELPDPKAVPFETVARFARVGREEYERALRGEGRWGEPIALLCSYLATAESYVRISERAWSLLAPDLRAVYFELPDAVCHLFARFAPPRRMTVSEEGWERFSGTVEEVYRHQDELLGKLLGLVGPEVAVFVVSDHGFKWGERRPEEGDEVEVGRAHLWHEPEGIFVAAGAGIRRRQEIGRASVLDVTPTLLRYLGLPTAKDMDGAPLLDIFEPAWLEENAARQIDSYATGSAQGSEREGGWEEVAEGFAREQEERLAGLGYLSRSGAAPEARRTRIELLLEAGRFAEAEQEVEELLRQTPADASLHLALAELCRRTERRERARKEYEVALGIAPDEPFALAGLGEVLAEQGDLQAGEAWLRLAIERGEGPSRFHLSLGHVLHLQGRLEDARGEFRLALEKDPRSADAFYNLGVLADREGRSEEAARLYREAVLLDPWHPRARMNLAVVVAKMGERREALGMLAEVAREAPEDAEVRYNLGALYLDLGMARNAVEELEAAVRVNPTLRLAHFQLGRGHAAMGEPLKALRAFEVAAGLDGRDAEARFAIAVLEAGLGRTEEARRALESAVVIGGTSIEERARMEPLLNPLLLRDASPR